MSLAKDPEAPAGIVIGPVKGIAPAPQAHLAIAAKYAAAEHHHIAAAHALKSGKSDQAKAHFDAACGHSVTASELNDDIGLVYKFWES